MSHTAFISLGSNASDKKAMVTKAMTRLGTMATAITCSDVYFTEPISGVGVCYANAVALISTNLTCSELDAALKALELSLGRDKSSATVAIDLDPVIYDGKVVRPADFARSYFRIGYDTIQRHSS